MSTVIGSMDDRLLVRKEGKDLMIGFNPRFLMDALRVIDDEEVSLYMTNAKSPLFIRDEKDSYIYLILPSISTPTAIDMIIESIDLKDFRNYRELRLIPSPGISIFMETMPRARLIFLKLSMLAAPPDPISPQGTGS